MTDLEALVVAAYVFADEYRVPARQGRPALVSDAELVALAVAQAAIGISSDRQFLGLVGRVLAGWPQAKKGQTPFWCAASQTASGPVLARRELKGSDPFGCTGIQKGQTPF